MRATDFRYSARKALRDKWFIAIVASMIASIFSSGSGGVSISFDFDEADLETLTNLSIDNLSVGMVKEYIIAHLPIIIGVAVVSLVFSVAMLLIGCVVSVGYAQFNLDLVDGFTPRIKTLFSRFSQMRTAVSVSLLVFLRVFVGFIFFFIPGIIAGYKYAMIYYVLAENPNLTARQAMERSKHIMWHNKWRLFCLDMSFFGWNLLSIITLGAAAIAVAPYQCTSRAVFYREVSRDVSFSHIYNKESKREVF